MRRILSLAALALAAAAPCALAAPGDERIACPEATTMAERTSQWGLERWCQRAGPAPDRHGPYVVLHSNGRLHLRGQYRDGKATGTWRTWYPTGAQSGEAEYHDARTTGMLLGWYENGRASLVAGYRDGTPITRLEIFDADGRLRLTTDYDARGAETARRAWDPGGRAIDPRSVEAQQVLELAMQTSVLLHQSLGLQP